MRAALSTYFKTTFCRLNGKRLVCQTKARQLALLKAHIEMSKHTRIVVNPLTHINQSHWSQLGALFLRLLGFTGPPTCQCCVKYLEGFSAFHNF